MANRYTFSEEEKKQVEEAVKALERESCGEIVPYFVSSSDDYLETSWQGGVVMAGAVAATVGLLSYFWMLPIRLTPFGISLSVLVALLVGFLGPMIFPVLRHWMVSDDRKARRVNQRAVEAFLAEGVYKTEERVGILIFISALEHQVVVLGDEGINAKVKPEDWQHVVNAVITGIRQKQIARGLVEAIGLCKELLLQNGFVRKSSDTNELGDELRLGD